jgi:uncharacterized protein YgiM (DUF1202 family)
LHQVLSRINELSGKSIFLSSAATSTLYCVEFKKIKILKQKPYNRGIKMKRKLTFASTLFFVFFFLVPFSYAATTLYVTSENAELKSESSSSSATIVELMRGSKLTLLAQEGRWYKVTALADQVGWIYRGKVSEEEPEIEESDDNDGGLGGLLGGLSGSDINADAADSSRSIRGLSPEAKEYADAAGSTQQSQDALDSVIEQKVDDQEIDQFLKQGKVGEYAE